MVAIDMSEQMSKVAQNQVQKELEQFLESIERPGITYFPIRHHSPACAWHLQQLIRERKPKAILIEGPAALAQWIKYLIDPELVPPVAIYMSWAVKDKKEVTESNPARVAAYFPFCDYSPELVALREGTKFGARLSFIDLSYAEQVVVESQMEEHLQQWQSFSLLQEAHLNSSHYVQELARRMGCRDHDELWDHLFESRVQELSTAQFIKQVAAYCYMSRQEYPLEVLELDGTLARERRMASCIKKCLAELDLNKEEIIVVTGGFHTANLPILVAELKNETMTSEKVDPVEYHLIRYSFDQLDALNGYASGMRAPFYYQRFWTYLNQEQPVPARETAAELLVEIGRELRREQLPFAISPADELAALYQAELLAGLRGHAAPTREDFLDAIRSCFVKGALDSEGVLLLSMVKRILAGDQIGILPSGVPLPPLMLNLQQTATRLKLKLNQTMRRELKLEIYRKARHRELSRFFHALSFLEVPLARFIAGPNFVKGIGLDYLTETWEYLWSPQIEVALLKLAVFGTTLTEVAVRRLDQVLAETETAGEGRNAGMAVEFLLRALQMGLHPYLENLLRRIEFSIAEDAAFDSLVKALRQLTLISKAREPLEAEELTVLPELITAAYRKACYLAQDLDQVPIEATQTIVEHLGILVEILEGTVKGDLDAELYLKALEVLNCKITGNTGVLGAAAGILYRQGRLSVAELKVIFEGYLKAATFQNRAKTDFIYGLLQSCRELLWSEPWFLISLDELWQTWNEAEFLRELPQLRLSFTELSPGEIDRVAARVAELHGVNNLGELVSWETTAEEVEQNLLLNELLKESLQEDSLTNWLELWTTKRGERR